MDHCELYYHNISLLHDPINSFHCSNSYWCICCPYHRTYISKHHTLPRHRDSPVIIFIGAGEQGKSPYRADTGMSIESFDFHASIICLSILLIYYLSNALAPLDYHPPTPAADFAVHSIPGNRREGEAKLWTGLIQPGMTFECMVFMHPSFFSQHY